MRAMALSEIKSQLEKLTSQLTFGSKCSKEEQESLEKFLNFKHQVFALEDCELGEVDLVEHKVEMTEHKPFQTPPRCLPLGLRLLCRHNFENNR